MKRFAIVTGASSGVGLAITKHLCSQGIHVLAIARRIELLKDRLSNFNSLYTPVYCDLSNLDHTTKVARSVYADYDIDILVNNAAILTSGTVDDLHAGSLVSASNTNCFSPAILMSLAICKMKPKNFGRIVNITSGAPLNCFPNVGLYSATKSFLNAMSITAAKENLQTNIKINLMSPGPVKTEMSPEAKMDPTSCLPTLDFLLDSSSSTPTGIFMWLGYQVPLTPDLSGIDWLNGVATGSLEKLIK